MAKKKIDIETLKEKLKIKPEETKKNNKKIKQKEENNKERKEEENPFEDKQKFSQDRAIDIPTPTLTPITPQAPVSLEEATSKASTQEQSTTPPPATNPTLYTTGRQRVENMPIYTAPNVIRESRAVVEDFRKSGAMTDISSQRRMQQREARTRDIQFVDPNRNWIDSQIEMRDYYSAREKAEGTTRELASPVSPQEFKGKKDLRDIRQYDEAA